MKKSAQDPWSNQKVTNLWIRTNNPTQNLTQISAPVFHGPHPTLLDLYKMTTQMIFFMLIHQIYIKEIEKFPFHPQTAFWPINVMEIKQLKER
jgi:hypothetical protein